MQVFPWLYIPLSNITDEMSRARFPVFIKNILKSDQNSREGARRLHSRLPPCMKLRLCLPYSAGRTSTSSVSPSRMDFSLGRSSPVFSSRLEDKAGVRIADGLAASLDPARWDRCWLAVTVEDDAQLGVAALHPVGHHVPVAGAVAEDHQGAGVVILGRDEVGDNGALALTLGLGVLASPPQS